jgi:hypothetical protein
VKPVLALPLIVTLLLCSCTTLQNRRYLWEPETINGPYTRMLKEKTWQQSTKVEQQTEVVGSSEKPWGK